MRRHGTGFTLIELVVAVLITAIVFAMGYGALDQALGNRDSIRASAERLTALQTTMRLLVQDFSQAAPRPVREPLGEGYRAALLADGQQVSLTRAGASNPAGVQRSTLQRVRYVLEDGVLYREQWAVLDATLEPEPQRRALLDNVTAFSVRFMNDARTWQQDWPTPQPGGGDWVLAWRPLAVEVTVETEDWGRVVRLVELTG